MSPSEEKPEAKGSTSPPFRRYTIDLTSAAANEAQRIQAMFNLTMADVFSSALLLMSVYANAVAQGQQVRIVDPNNPRTARIIKLPLFMKSTLSDSMKVQNGPK